ncbi:MAG: GNAT family N-acetyltransferase [Pseudomonadales bacterium]
METRQLLEISKEVLSLAEIAKAEGHNNIQTLVAEFRSGKNRFLKEGEVLLGAFVDDELVGIGGLNVDPYETEDIVARVRRLYVLPDFRRRGIATRLMRQIERKAAQHFRRIQLYTNSGSASQFYSRLGYSKVSDRRKVSHEKRLDA